MKKIISTFFIILFLVGCTLLTVGCQPSIDEVYVRANSFNANYAIDSNINYQGAFLVVEYSDDTKEDVAITPDMISNFNTSTTGQKTMTISYQEYKIDVDYLVYNPENASLEILTSSRLSLACGKSLTHAEYTVSYRKGDLSILKAVTFTLKTSSTLGIEEDESLLEVGYLPDGWTYDFLIVNATTVKFVVYAYENAGINSDANLINVMVLGKDVASSPTLIDVTVSDGINNYRLPKVS